MTKNTPPLALALSILLPGSLCGQQLQSLPGLQQIVITELTTTSNTLTLSPNDPKLLARRTDPMTSSNSDLSTQAGELYDVFYSDSAGTLRQDGQCLSIQGVFNAANQVGFNIAQVDFQFQNTPTKSPNTIGSLVVGNDYVINSENAAIDNSPTTFSSLGNTNGRPAGFRMRLTLCFCEPPCCQPGGACCFGNLCLDPIQEQVCRKLQGVFLGIGRACDEGACRIGTQCTVLSRAKCLERGGQYAGPGTSC